MLSRATRSKASANPTSEKTPAQKAADTRRANKEAARQRALVSAATEPTAAEPERCESPTKGKRPTRAAKTAATDANRAASITGRKRTQSTGMQAQPTKRAKKAGPDSSGTVAPNDQSQKSKKERYMVPSQSDDDNDMPVTEAAEDLRRTGSPPPAEDASIDIVDEDVQMVHAPKICQNAKHDLSDADVRKVINIDDDAASTSSKSNGEVEVEAEEEEDEFREEFREEVGRRANGGQRSKKLRERIAQGVPGWASEPDRDADQQGSVNAKNNVQTAATQSHKRNLSDYRPPKAKIPTVLARAQSVQPATQQRPKTQTPRHPSEQRITLADPDQEQDSDVDSPVFTTTGRLPPLAEHSLCGHEHDTKDKRQSFRSASNSQTKSSINRDMSRAEPDPKRRSRQESQSRTQDEDEKPSPDELSDGRTWSSKTDIVVTPKRTVKIGDQTGVVRAIVKLTTALSMPASICWKDAFPLSDSRSAQIKEACIMAARTLVPEAEEVLERLEVDKDFAWAMSYVPDDRISSLRNKVKALAIATVKASYDLKRTPDDTWAKTIENLLKDDLYIFPAKGAGYDFNQPFYHDAIIDVIRDGFFSKNAIVCFPHTFYESSINEGAAADEVELPLPMIALCATAVCSALEELRHSRVRTQIEFSADKYWNTYNDHMTTLESIKENPVGFHNLLHELYKTASGVGSTKLTAAASKGKANRYVNAATIGAARN